MRDAGLGVPQRDEPAVVREDRVGVVELCGGVDGAGQGWRSSQGVPVVKPAPGEASHDIGTGALSRPLHASARITSAESSPRATAVV
ncbi:MAG TPA: hypothetical protein VI094_09245 [Propionibacteriaceae bacterium]